MIREENINCTVEALILSSTEPVSIKKICDVIEGVSPARVRQAIDDLNNIYFGCGNSFRIRELAGGYQMYILPDFEVLIKKLLSKQRTIRLSRPALETLAIIAYRQPVTKIDIEHIRGVDTDGVIHNLLQRKLIVIAGRTNSPGRPLLYKTSNEFLKFFGLNRLSDLPNMQEIVEMIKQAETPREQTSLPLSEEDTSPPAETEQKEAAGEFRKEEQSELPESQVEILIEDEDNGSEPTVDSDKMVGSEILGVTPPPVDAESAEKVGDRLPAALFEEYIPIPDDPPPVFFVEKQTSLEEEEEMVSREEAPVSPPIVEEKTTRPTGLKLPAATFEDYEPLPDNMAMPAFDGTIPKSDEDPAERAEETIAAETDDK